MNKKGSKHLTIGDRATIESLLNQRRPLLEVAEAIRKDPRSISREVKNRRIGHECLKGSFNGQKDRGDCKTLLRWPYVCNGCPKKAKCMFRARWEYSAKEAQSDYERTLSESRDGLDMTPEDMACMEERMRECVEKGRSPASEFVAHEGEMPCSLRSFYRRVDEGKSSVISLDLIRKVKLRKRRRKAARAESPNPARKGREYADFLRFLAAHPGIFVVEIDTVESGRGDPSCLLTIHFTFARFMLAIKLASKTAAEVSRAFRSLRAAVGDEAYRRLFPVVLTDNGCEFFEPEAIEFSDATGERLTSLFFCESYASYQKGAIEENHTLVRYVFPKGFCFGGTSQEKVDLAMSNVDSYCRESLGTCPYALMAAYYGEEILAEMKIRAVSPDLIVLRPTLIK
jgi:IS30 family transposase